jgi:hypothetical protein
VVQAIVVHFPIFTGGESLFPYRPFPEERYFPFAPGIEVSVQAYDGGSWHEEREPELSVYNRKGQISFSQKKGVLLDTSL